MNTWNGHKFAILMPWGRVGSNLVVGVLCKNNKVSIANEPTTALRSRAANEPNKEFSIDSAQIDYLRTFPTGVYGKFPARKNSKFGVKLAHRSFVSPMMAYATLREQGYRLVTMDRRNHVKSAVSLIRANQRRATAQKSAFAVAVDERKPGPTIIPPANLIRLAKVFQEKSALMQHYANHEYGAEKLEIYYEDMLQDPKTTIRQIADYLDISLPADFELPYKKTTNDSLCEDILNYDEVVKELSKVGMDEYLMK